MASHEVKRGGSQVDETEDETVRAPTSDTLRAPKATEKFLLEEPLHSTSDLRSLPRVAMTSRTFPTHCFVWSRKIEGLEDFVQLFLLIQNQYNEREFLVEWKTVLQEKQEEICSTDLLTAFLAITKNEIIPLTVEYRAETYDAVPRLHYNIIKNSFTAGILIVLSEDQHTINNKGGYIYVYICKHNEKPRYKTNASRGRALINKTQILKDFHAPELVIAGKPYVVLQNSIYFFYATNPSSFTIIREHMKFQPAMDFSIFYTMNMYTGPISRSCFREYEPPRFYMLLGYPGLYTLSKLDSKLLESTQEVTPLTICPKPVLSVMENRLVAVEKELESIRNENMRLKVVEKELEQVKNKHLTNSVKLENVKTELRNVKSENVSLKVAERTLENTRKENTRLKADRKKLENISDNFQNEHKDMKIEAREIENIKYENMRLKIILQQVCHLTKDIM